MPLHLRSQGPPLVLLLPRDERALLGHDVLLLGAPCPPSSSSSSLPSPPGLGDGLGGSGGGGGVGWAALTRGQLLEAVYEHYARPLGEQEMMGAMRAHPACRRALQASGRLRHARTHGEGRGARQCFGFHILVTGLSWPFRNHHGPLEILSGSNFSAGPNRHAFFGPKTPGCGTHARTGKVGALAQQAGGRCVEGGGQRDQARAAQTPARTVPAPPAAAE
jgi:hypothetical protein